MAAEAVKLWLRRKKRRTLVASGLYAAAAIAGGVLAFGLTLGLVFLAAKILVLVAAPFAHRTDVFSPVIVVIVATVLIIDSLRAERDDMSIVPLWLAREYLHLGPRMFLEGLRTAVRMGRFAQLDIVVGAEVLSHLATQTMAVSKAELMSAVPGLVWSRLVAQLEMLDGVLILRPADTRVTLILPLRLELRALLGTRRRVVPPPVEEPPPPPVTEPDALSPREILGVGASASAAEIKKAYRSRVKECHPDRFAGMDAESRRQAEEWTKALNTAYALLLAETSAAKRRR